MEPVDIFMLLKAILILGLVTYLYWLSKNKKKVIIVSNQDHESNTGVWRNLASQGFEVREWKVRSNGSLYLDDLKEIVDKTVCLIAFPHASNIIGQVNPVKAICSLAKEAGAFTCVDGVSYACLLYTSDAADE